MNRPWIALAGLVLVGVAAVALDLRDYAARSISAAQCAGVSERLATLERNDPASARFLRDLLRLAGQCGSRDMAGAIRDIEAALQSDLDESAILLYADALLVLGRNDRAGPWIRPAIAISLTATSVFASPFARLEVHSPWLRRAIDRTSLALESGSARRIVAELEASFARSPLAPSAERRLIRLALAKLERADPRESLYWLGRSSEWDNAIRPRSENFIPDYAGAIECGDRRAMRRLAALYFREPANFAWGRDAYYGLVLLPDPTAEERALLATLEPRFGTTPLDMSNPMMRESRARAANWMCESRLRRIAERPSEN
jgi:hypothetical protein